MLCAGVSAAGQNLSISPRDLVFSGRSLLGTVEGDANPQYMVPHMINCYRSGNLPLDKLITTYDFNDINNAIQDLQEGRTIKPVLIMPNQQSQ